MQNVDMEVAGSRVTIDFTRTRLNVETRMDRAQEVLPLTYALLSADDTWLKLTGDDLAARAHGCLAMNMICEGATQSATKRAELLMAIADGSEAIADHGFPEFEDGHSLDV
jgi:hypothetical protein